jgi:hypothetical protein
MTTIDQAGWFTPVISATQEAEIGKITLQDRARQKVDYLSSKCKALSSSPSITKKKKIIIFN